MLKRKVPQRTSHMTETAMKTIGTSTDLCIPAYASVCAFPPFT